MLSPASRNKALAMAVFGMDAKAFGMLDLAMQKMGRGMAVFVDGAESEAAIFNFDHPDAGKKLAGYRKQRPDNPVIVLALRDPQQEGCLFVKKPFDMQTLLKAIRQLQKQKQERISERNSQEMAHAGISSVKIQQPPKHRLAPITPVVDFQAEKNKDRKFCGNAEDIDLGDEKQRTRVFYDPNDALQGRLQAACELARQKQQAVILIIKFENDMESITLLPKINRALITMDDKRLAYLCTVPLYCLETKSLRQNREKTAELEKHAIESKCGSIDALLWNVALWTSRGRIPRGTSFSKPVFLRHWPNFTRLHVTPGAFSIAALLHDKPMPLSLLLNLLSIPQRYVFAFYSGAHALGLIAERDAGQSRASATEGKAAAHPHRRLFGLIMEKLKKAV